MSSAPIAGLIAGQTQLPVLVARGMKQAGKRVVCVGIRDHFVPDLRDVCDEFHEAGLLQVGKWIRILRRAGVHEATLVGRVSKARIHDPWRMLKALRDLPDLRTVNLWYRRLRHDRRTSKVLAALVDELANGGIALVDSTQYIAEHMASAGPMGRVHPDARTQADIAFGWPLLERISALDVGQAITVNSGDVVAVEAVEGTDSMIERTGQLCRAKGWTLMKTARPGHDMRADVPTVGVMTIEKLARAGAGCLALGTGRVILVDRPAVIAAADKAGIAIVGVGDL